MKKDKYIKSPELLRQYFEDYRAWAKSNPIQENHYSHKHSTQVSIDKERPLTWKGFQIYLRKKNIISKLQDYDQNTNGSYTEYQDVISEIKDEIYDDKYTGAAVGIYQHNIVARDLGLVDKKEVDNVNDKVTKIKIIKSCDGSGSDNSD